VRATRRAHPFTPTRGKSPLPQRFCAEPMYPYQFLTSPVNGGGTATPSPHAGRAGVLRGVGFFSRGWHGGRDARVPSVARAGSASVSLAWWQKRLAEQRREQARPQKPTPLSLQVAHASQGEPRRTPTRFPLLAGGTLRRGRQLLFFVNSGSAIGITTPLP
jgi:hypothetical protein